MDQRNIETAGASPAAIASAKAFVTGHGQYHTHGLTRPDGTPNPHPLAGKPYPTITGKEIVAMVRNPPSVPKEKAQWVIASTYTAHDAREFERQRAAGEFWALSLDEDDEAHNNLDLADVRDAIRAVCGDAARLIYSTRSSTPESRRWRAIVWLHRGLAGADYRDTQEAFFSLLEEASAGVLIPDRAFNRAAQLIYLPNRGEFYDHEVHTGDRLDLTSDHPIILRREDNRRRRAEAAAAAERMRQTRRRRAETDDNASIVEAFNKATTVAAELERAGYRRAGASDDWRSPYQTSGSYATRDFGDFWISLSSSDAGNGVGNVSPSGHAIGDAFDLFCHFEHGGDFRAAVRAYARETRQDYASRRERDAPHEPDRPTTPPADQGASKPPPPPPPAFRFVPVGDLEYRAPEFLIEGLIETETFGQIFGDPGCGKTFTATDLALCVAAGTDFHGRKVMQGPVLYIAGEGHNGLTRRFAAWSNDRGVPLKELPMFKSERAAQFLDGASARAVAEAADALAKAYGTPRLIVIDTLARNFGAGDENSTSDMSNFIVAIDDLKARYPGCVVLIVHHTGHGDKNRARGSSTMFGALDFEFCVKKDGGCVCVSNTKMKDAEPPPDLWFSLETVELGFDRNGKPVTSAVLRSEEAPERQASLSPAQKLAMATYQTAAIEHGIWSGNGFKGVHVDHWREAFYHRHTGDNPQAKKKAFQRVRTDLINNGALSVADDVYLANDSATQIAIMMAPKPQKDA